MSHPETPKNATFAVRGVLFAYGGLENLAVWRILVNWLYRDSANTSFVNHPLTNVAITFLGGLFASVILAPLLVRVVSEKVYSSAVVFLRAALLGLLANLVALQTLLVFAAVLVAWSTNQREPGMFVLAFLDIETYGIQGLVLSVPFGLLSGVLAGAVATWIQKAQTVEGGDSR